MKIYLAELVGTALLVLIGCGVAIFTGSSVGVLGIAMAFGLAITLVTYLIGSISGAHANPAVTIALALAGKFRWKKVPGYIVAQVLGALIGASILFAIVANVSNGNFIINAGFGTNALRGGVSMTAGALVEIFMTMIFCLVVLATTRSNWPSTSTPIATGLALFSANLVAIPLTGASINPARSIGPALVSNQNVSSLGLFIAAPIVGAILAYFIDVFVIGKGHFHYKKD